MIESKNTRPLKKSDKKRGCNHLASYKTTFNGYYCPACLSTVSEEEIENIKKTLNTEE